MPGALARGYHYPMNPNRRTVLAALLGCLAGVVLATVAFWAGHGAREDAGIPCSDARLLAEVIGLIREDYVDRTDNHQLMSNAIRGMVGELDPHSAFIDAGVVIAPDTLIEPDTHLLGTTSVGGGCTIGPGTNIRDSVIGDDCVVRYSMIEESTLEAGVDVGPYSHLRPGSYICQGAHIGNFAEVKGARLGRRTKMGHHSYIGDADVGDDVNIGAGTITANFDGESKHRTVIARGQERLMGQIVRIGHLGFVEEPEIRSAVAALAAALREAGAVV